MTWQQEDFPEEKYVGSVRYDNGNHTGSILLDHETKTFQLSVIGHSPVSHDDFVGLAHNMFEAKGWPTPALNGTEKASCADEI